MLEKDDLYNYRTTLLGVPDNYKINMIARIKNEFHVILLLCNS